MNSIPMEQWGKDHWSTLAYIETCVVDSKGVISNAKMRCDNRIHPERDNGADGKRYPTVLKDGTTVDEHDDWSCVEDMIAAGLIFVKDNNALALTEQGWKVAGLLRRHRAKDGSWNTFVDYEMSINWVG